MRSFFNTHTRAKTNTKNYDTRKDLITMFREDNNTYYRTDCNNTNHADKIVRQPKKKALLDTKQYYLNAAKRRLCHICHVDPDNHNEIESIKRKIRKLEREIETIQSMKIQHKNLHKCKKLNPDKILDYCIRVLEDSKKHDIYFITAEDIAYQLNTHVYLVKQCFTKMNHMGLLSQPTHKMPHDCYRPKRTEWDTIDSGWAGNVYYIR